MLFLTTEQHPFTFALMIPLFAVTCDLSAFALLNNLVAAIINKQFEFGEVCAVFRIYFWDSIERKVTIHPPMLIFRFGGLIIYRRAV